MHCQTDKGIRRFQEACAYLFSPAHARDPNFLNSLDAQRLKQAFRTKAKRYHPDLHHHENRALQKKRRDRFIRIQRSYEYLRCRVKPGPEPEQGKAKQAPPRRPAPRIIAVGGAKGGIGKSLFAANLAIGLASKGYRTVAADLDLGGANLHLYLGLTRLTRTINDFLTKKAAHLDEILEETAYGPGLIGGNSSCLGAANIGFARKLKLIKAIRGLNADYVVVDLGGDTAYNVLDFFLAADLGLVMTTCDPAAYLDAYAFIKVALYRQLNRIFGPESFYPGPVDPILRRLIQKATLSPEMSSVKPMAHLRDEVRKRSPGSTRILDRVLQGFTPKIVVNQAGDEVSALAPVKRIQMVSRKTLSVNLSYLGALPHETQIKTSARTLIPIMASNPETRYAQKLNSLVSGPPILNSTA